MLIALGVVVVLGAVVLEVAVSMRARGDVIAAREEAEDWRTVAENLGALVDGAPLMPLEQSRLAKVMAQLHACREAYPR